MRHLSLTRWLNAVGIIDERRRDCSSMMLRLSSSASAASKRLQSEGFQLTTANIINNLRPITDETLFLKVLFSKIWDFRRSGDWWDPFPVIPLYIPLLRPGIVGGGGRSQWITNLDIWREPETPVSSVQFEGVTTLPSKGQRVHVRTGRIWLLFPVYELKVYRPYSFV